MNVTINGSSESFVDAPTLADLVTQRGRDPKGKGVAIALNGEVIPRSKWGSVTLSEDDRIELLEAVQGG